jgi:hypothetical protein
MLLALALDEGCDRLDGSKMVDVQIVVGQRQLKFLLYEQHELHREHRVDEAGSKDVIVVSQVGASNVALQKLPDQWARIFAGHCHSP